MQVDEEQTDLSLSIVQRLEREREVGSARTQRLLIDLLEPTAIERGMFSSKSIIEVSGILVDFSQWIRLLNTHEQRSN